MWNYCFLLCLLSFPVLDITALGIRWCYLFCFNCQTQLMKLLRERMTAKGTQTAPLFLLLSFVWRTSFSGSLRAGLLEMNLSSLPSAKIVFIFPHPWRLLRGIRFIVGNWLLLGWLWYLPPSPWFPVSCEALFKLSLVFLILLPFKTVHSRHLSFLTFIFNDCFLVWISLFVGFGFHLILVFCLCLWLLSNLGNFQP